MLSVHARLSGDRLGVRDLDRSMTFGQWNDRACRLASALLGLGLNKGARVAVLAYSCGAGLQLSGMAGDLCGCVESRPYPCADQLPPGRPGGPLHHRERRRRGLDRARRAHRSDRRDPLRSGRGQRELYPFGDRPCPAGYRDHEMLLGSTSGSEPALKVDPSDPWTLMYTSGTTGNPKGVLRNNRSGALLALITEIELGLNRADGALLVKPMCHTPIHGISSARSATAVA